MPPDGLKTITPQERSLIDMDCKAVTRARQCAPLMPGASPPAAPIPLTHEESDAPSGLLALATAFTDIDFRGTYTVKEVAGILQLTTDKTYDLIRTESIPFIHVGRQYRVGRFALWAHINGLRSDELVEQVMHSFVRQHCCRAGRCEGR